MGRPKLPKGEAKGVVIGARFSPAESTVIHTAIKNSKQEKPAWVRTALLDAAIKGH
jgi:hypothetical protein